MATEYATRPTASRVTAPPASITPALLKRLTARVSAAPDAAGVTTSAPYRTRSPVPGPRRSPGPPRQSRSARGSCCATTTSSWPARTRPST